MTAVLSTTSITDRSGDGYEEFAQSIRDKFDSAINDYSPYLFTTDATGLFDTFLAGLPDDARQHYNCRCCQKFIENYGGLVVIDADGDKFAAMWNSMVPELFQPSIRAMKQLILKSSITGVFLSGHRVWGTPVTGEWHHMHVVPPAAMVFSHSLLTAGQKMAEKVQDYEVLQRSLAEYSLPIVEQAVTLLKVDALYRSEKCLGVAEWFQRLYQALAATKNTKAQANLVWLAVASAPAGFCYVRSSMIGTLLDDLQAGMSVADVRRRFAEKMNPLQYQRPQAAPSAGNIEQAEKIVEKLGIANALKRRFATLADIQALWLPKAPQQRQQTGGVFGHLKTKEDAPAGNSLKLPLQTMTWDKFQRTILPNAIKIEYMVAREQANYSALVTAADMDAPPILQWDNAEQRNPVSWYVYHNGSTPAAWNLSTGWVDVTAVTLQPSMWYGTHSHQSESVFFILQGAKDMRYKYSGIALFPEILKSELREVRSTIEAFSKTAMIQGFDEASACGIRLQKGDNWKAKFRVTTALSVGEYELDRWD